ncbi:hypothetical protein Pint_18159 [Pistacia integerrima]|uniref:Uncharacterized protein n=1 Tax=Pistacia integerrima TaxID=434235 RepID=A0ACC0YVL2_9ROSI|nr:hypothetical protein Pint_18159 [Pistacia integerrima]
MGNRCYYLFLFSFLFHGVYGVISFQVFLLIHVRWVFLRFKLYFMCVLASTKIYGA